MIALFAGLGVAVAILIGYLGHAIGARGKAKDVQVAKEETAAKVETATRAQLARESQAAAAAEVKEGAAVRDAVEARTAATPDDALDAQLKAQGALRNDQA